MRAFFVTYPIRDAQRRELSWTHYRPLLRVDNPAARASYEAEAVNARWATRELERQINSLLFERLALSRDKAGVMALAHKGHEITRPSDLVKDPMVLEFTGLRQDERFRESDLEQALIAKLQLFLLELGKGFAFIGRQQRTSSPTCRQGVMPLDVTADHVEVYKRAVVEASMKPTTVARLPSVLLGSDKQLGAKGLVSRETLQDTADDRAPDVRENATPSLTQRQAIALLEAIPTHTIQGIRDLALMSVFFLTGCRVSAVTGACVGHLETDGVEHYLHVTEKRNRKRRKILLDAARPVLAYVAQAGIKDDREGPLFRPLRPNGTGLVRRHLDRKTPWRLVKKYCEAAGIDPSRLGARGIGIHSLRKTAINDAIRNGATMHEVREFAGHADIRTTEVYFVRKEEDAEVAARRIQIRVVRSEPRPTVPATAEAGGPVD
jgi:predicted nuclease of restriction endonuclease-like (RecB) superfamily/site-specific recombinase XerD